MEDGLLGSYPSLSKTSRASFWMPLGKMEVRRWLEAQERRIINYKRMWSHHFLREYVFRERSEHFLWDQSSCNGFTVHTIEREEPNDNDILFRGNRKLLPCWNDFESSEAKETEPTGTKASYKIRSFVGVRAVENESDAPIWIRKVLSTFLNDFGSVSKFWLHCFDTRSVEQRLSEWYLL